MTTMQIVEDNDMMMISSGTWLMLGRLASDFPRVPADDSNFDPLEEEVPGEITAYSLG